MKYLLWKMNAQIFMNTTKDFKRKKVILAKRCCRCWKWTRTWGVTEKVLKVTKQTYQIVCCPQGTRALSKVAQSVTRLHSSPVVLLSCRKRPWVSSYWCDFFFLWSFCATWKLTWCLQLAFFLISVPEHQTCFMTH